MGPMNQIKKPSYTLAPGGLGLVDAVMIGDRRAEVHERLGQPDRGLEVVDRYDTVGLVVRYSVVDACHQIDVRPTARLSVLGLADVFEASVDEVYDRARLHGKSCILHDKGLNVVDLRLRLESDGRIMPIAQVSVGVDHILLSVQSGGELSSVVVP